MSESLSRHVASLQMKLVISARFVGLILFLLHVEKKLLLQCVNSILETKAHFLQMNAYEFIQLVSGSDANSKHQRHRHPSLKEPILKMPRAHLHSTYWHCFSIRGVLMAARVGLHFLRLSDILIMKHFQQERVDFG